MALELGLGTFGDVSTGADGRPVSHGQVIRDVIEEAVLADRLGVDHFGIGEHHRADFAVSAPEVVLGAIAARTRRIRLGSAVTVLSSDDPVRVFQRFTTLDAISSGRAEVILGRGSFIESFPLFGHELGDYERLFEEKLDLFATLLRQDVVTWSGTVRAPLRRQTVYPRPDRVLSTWVGVGGSPQSVVRAARHELPMMLGIIGGEARRFGPHVELYRRMFAQSGRPAQPVGVQSQGYVAETDARARDELWPDFRQMRDRIGAERGWPPMSRDEFEQEVDQGSLYVGAPDTVARKIVATASVLGLSRFDLKYCSGPMPHERLLRGIELYGSTVIPMVREMLGVSRLRAAS